jgi:toxin ParE1/3/4
LSLPYVLTSAAEADLRDIVRYTRREWGEVQARRYLAGLKAGIERIATGPVAGRDMTSLHPGLRMARCRHHFIFFLPRANAPTLVVELFHERMDLIARLAVRLGESGG